MKKYAVLLLIIVNQNLNAQFCESDLVKKSQYYPTTIRTFGASDVTVKKSCKKALMKCEWEKIKNANQSQLLCVVNPIKNFQLRNATYRIHCMNPKEDYLWTKTASNFEDVMFLTRKCCNNEKAVKVDVINFEEKIRSEPCTFYPLN